MHAPSSTPPTAKAGLALAPCLEGHETPVLAALLSSSSHGILMTDLAGNDMACNARFGELFDLDPQLVVRSSRDEVRRMAKSRMSDPEAFEALMARIYEDPLLDYEDEMGVTTAPPRVLRRHTGPVLDAQGTKIGRLWTFEDITKERELEAQVRRHAQSLAAKVDEQARELDAAHQKLIETARINAAGSLAVGIAHDLRDIMTTLYLELDAGSVPSGTDAVRAQLDRLATLTHRLLGLSRPSAVHFGPTHIAEVISYVVSLVESQARVDGVRLSVRMADNLRPTAGDPQRLEYLLVNLLLNALNCMAASGGLLTIAAEMEGRMLRIDVSDTGPGIPEDVRDRIFEAFFTTRANRVGLGLYSARRIAEEHDGRIEVASSGPAGSRFSVWLPALDAEG